MINIDGVKKAKSLNSNGRELLKFKLGNPLIKANVLTFESGDLPIKAGDLPLEVGDLSLKAGDRSVIKCR